MKDRELLELAAKAAGLKVTRWSDGDEPYSSGAGFFLESGRLWNPLTSDGYALRLAVQLHIDLKCYEETVRTWVGDPAARRVLASIEELCGADPYAATRRAIVRAAAEIGKAAP